MLLFIISVQKKDDKNARYGPLVEIRRTYDKDEAKEIARELAEKYKDTNYYVSVSFEHQGSFSGSGGGFINRHGGTSLRSENWIERSSHTFSHLLGGE